MFCKPTELRQLWGIRLPDHTTLYAFSFWSSSYTLVATVCRISPSQFVGIFLPRLRICKDCTSLPYYDEGQLGLSLGIAPSRERIPDSLGAGLPSVFKKDRNSSKNRGACRQSQDLTAPGLRRWDLQHRFCRPKVEGHDYVGKSLFSFC
jgi:hypothetical protein